MRYRIPFFIVIMMMMLSCQHSPLYDLNNTHYIRIYINDSIQNINKGLYHEDVKVKDMHLPEVMRVILSDKTTGQVVSERFLQHTGRDARGYYLDGYIGAPEGNYKLMAYNFGTETTQIRGEYNYYDMTGYTNHISPMYYPLLPRLDVNKKPSYDEQNILYDPDHLWVVTDEDVKVRDQMHIDTLYAADNKYYNAETIVDTYYIQVRVRGAQWISSSVSLLTGMANAKVMHNREMIGTPPAMVYFEMQERDSKKVSVPNNTPIEGNLIETEEAVIYATFNTWGKLPDVESFFRITFSFGISDGSNQTETMDITPLFTSDEARNHRWIIIDKVIEINAPEVEEGGGFSPEVDDWDEIETDVIL